jgi:hypothetical protein
VAIADTYVIDLHHVVADHALEYPPYDLPMRTEAELWSRVDERQVRGRAVRERPSVSRLIVAAGEPA